MATDDHYNNVVKFYKDIMQNDSRPLGEALGFVINDLSDPELFKFGTALERQYTLSFPHREWGADMFASHAGELLLGAMVAKPQMNSVIDGEIPAPGNIGGPVLTRAVYFGIGKDWEDAPAVVGTPAPTTFATGSQVNWIHSGTNLLAGTAANAVRIGTNAVHVIIAVGSYHPSPKLENVQFTLNGGQKPLHYLKWAQQAQPQSHSFRMKELDSAIFLKKNDTVLAKVFSSAANGSAVTDIPALIGASFIAEAQLRIADPTTIPGTTNDLILTT